MEMEQMDRSFAVNINKRDLLSGINAFFEEAFLCTRKFALPGFMLEARNGCLNIVSIDVDCPVVVCVEANVVKEGSSISSSVIQYDLQGLECSDVGVVSSKDGLISLERASVS